MPISTITQDASLLSIKEEDNLTRSNLEANPLTAFLAVPLATFIDQTWQPTWRHEIDLDYALSSANARVLYTDVVLNGLVKKLDGALLMLTGKDRSAPVYLLYFGAQRPSEVAAGILGPQLETMRSWVPLLLAAPEPTLQAIGAEIAVAVADADAAVKGKADAESAIKVFKTTGERAQLVDAYNALRKTTYGALGKLTHEHPELPNDFAETFFRHEGRRVDDRLSPEQLQLKIDALKAQQAALEKKQKALLDRQKEEADARAAQEEKQVAIDAKKKQKAALEAEIKSLEASL